MKNLRYGLIALSLMLCSITTATAGVSIGISLPTVSIGINLPVYPELVRVPGYPVYYAPQMDSNYFFYDGMYWVYSDDNWYASSWYNGPWGVVGPEYVPLYILRVPVRYYRQPPQYFRGWQSNAPPRWGQHWGRDWERNRSGWNRWNRGAAPAPAPLPVYQRQYYGDRYPRVEQQHELRSQQYRYQPRDRFVRQHIQQITPSAQQNRGPEPAMRSPKQPDARYVSPRQQGAPSGPNSQPPQRGGEQVRQPAPAPAPQQQYAPAAQRQQPGQPQYEQRQQPGQAQHEQQDRSEGQGGRGQGKGQRNDDDRGRGQGQGQRNDDDRGQGRNK